MLNQVVLVGKLYEIKEIGESNVLITLATFRPFKNADGEYETDYIDILLRGSVAKKTLEYCKKGDLIGAKGRIENLKESVIPAIIGEKITFLAVVSSKISICSSLVAKPLALS